MRILPLHYIWELEDGDQHVRKEQSHNDVHQFGVEEQVNLKNICKKELEFNIGWMEWTIGLLMLATIDPFDDI